MADFSGITGNGHRSNQEAEKRAGVGLLSRFLGAVFLVLLGGLLLLDRTLLRATHNEAILDTQTTGLLTESFVSAQVTFLDRIAGVIVGQEGTKNGSVLIKRVVTGVPGLRRRR